MPWKLNLAGNAADLRAAIERFVCADPDVQQSFIRAKSAMISLLDLNSSTYDACPMQLIASGHERKGAFSVCQVELKCLDAQIVFHTDAQPPLEAAPSQQSSKPSESTANINEGSPAGSTDGESTPDPSADPSASQPIATGPA